MASNEESLLPLLAKAKPEGGVKKTYLDVLGLCCSSEVAMIENIMKPLYGVKEISVIAPTKTLIVVHDNLISQSEIVTVLNQAGLEANVRAYGQQKYQMKWPSPYTIVCGGLLLLSSFKFLFQPLQWAALVAVVVGLPPVTSKAIAAIRSFSIDVNLLMLIAAGGSIALGDYWEAATIVFLFTIAEWLESIASHKATAAMSSLLSMAPQKAVLADSGLVFDAKDVKVNTILAVKPGEVIPIDGIVAEGMCEVDEKTLTGESFPVTKQKQSSVLAGSINLNGYITVRTTALAEDCVVSKMAKLVEEAQTNKSKTERLVDDIAKYYTPAVVLIAIIIPVVAAILRLHNLDHWFHLALVVLVSACPCALILSTPVATFSALTEATTNGLLFKGGDYLEILAKVKIVAFDKTGTITRGEFVVTDFHSICHDVSLNKLIYWVSSIESKSSHPIASALVNYAQANFVEPKPENVTEFQNFPGEGIFGQIDGVNIFVGNRRISTRAGCRTEETDDKGGATIGYIYSGMNLVGTFSLADACRSGVADAISELKSLGMRTVMLTGDSHAAAIHAQAQLCNAIEVVHAQLLPEDKARIVESLKEEQPTAMIGDGINDAPALATADIGISMGISGSALATETGHVTLMSNDIQKIPQAIRLARKTRRTIIENVSLSIISKVAVLSLAMTGHPILWAAVVADVGTCLIVVLNSMLLLKGTTSMISSCASDNCKQSPSDSCGYVTHGGEGSNNLHASCCNPASVCCSSPFASEGSKQSSYGGCESLTQRLERSKNSSGPCLNSSPVLDKCCSTAEPSSVNHLDSNGNMKSVSSSTCSSVLCCGLNNPTSCSESCKKTGDVRITI
ncbi:putative inactive cadmium/zinc-transporting ATPase HMA3 isoform X2 [Macadamia integrifolia]|uniref:putative inactive cadmium/zinc-transporting ATPase HMA3 isoform X2 n=1 Tax=Macadamia integrifolia TaxID=60698 RepID=UPI001C4F98C9|nr:putative inactive cadmium/zinc-transporting ATPase HMA3 isoform X2 [Macadamia integrifolia]